LSSNGLFKTWALKVELKDHESPTWTLHAPSFSGTLAEWSQPLQFTRRRDNPILRLRKFA
jgi:hypothetical protein